MNKVIESFKNSKFSQLLGQPIKSFFSIVTLQFWGIVSIIIFAAVLINRKTKYVVEKIGDV